MTQDTEQQRHAFCPQITDRLAYFFFYIAQVEPKLLEVIRVMANTNTYHEARKALAIDQVTFYECLLRLKLLSLSYTPQN